MVFSDDAIPSARLILCHKQKTSARLRFLLFSHGVLAFDALPSGARISADVSHTRVQLHPAAWTNQACERLGLDPCAISPEPEFHAEARCGDEIVSILLATFTSIDPPFDVAKRYSARFVPLTEMRELPSCELALLALVYEYLIG
jgi:hypothetical protein